MNASELIDDDYIPPGIHDLRKTVDGRQMLAAIGRTKNVPHGRLGEFISWDGEGINTDPTFIISGNMVRTHNYVLFGNSAGLYQQVYKGALATKVCFQLMLRTVHENPGSIHVAFAFNYDVEKILRQIPDERMARLYKDKVIREDGYRI